MISEEIIFSSDKAACFKFNIKQLFFFSLGKVKYKTTKLKRCLQLTEAHLGFSSNSFGVTGKRSEITASTSNLKVRRFIPIQDHIHSDIPYSPPVANQIVESKIGEDLIKRAIAS